MALHRDNPSRFTAWLRSNGFAHLAPDDEPRPLCSRIVYLQKRDAPEQDVKTLLRLWEGWRS